MRSGERCRQTICDLTLWHVHAAVCHVLPNALTPLLQDRICRCRCT